MRYILNSEGYVETVSFANPIVCNGSCTEYTGTTPTGYSSLLEWSENAVIQAYKITNGNLTHDPNKEAELETQWEIENIDTKIYYKPGEKYSFEVTPTPEALWLGGTFTTSRTQIAFSIFTPKNLKYINSITCEKLDLTVRSNLGSYIANGVTDKSKMVAYKTNENSIALIYTLDKAVETSTATNNTPAAICLKSLTLVFN